MAQRALRDHQPRRAYSLGFNQESRDIALLQPGRHVTECLFSAGYDFGADNTVGTNDDSRASGSMGAVSVGANMTNTTLVAGVSPGLNPTWGDGDDLKAGGKGKIASVKVKGAMTNCVIEAEHGTYAI